MVDLQVYWITVIDTMVRAGLTWKIGTDRACVCGAASLFDVPVFMPASWVTEREREIGPAAGVSNKRGHEIWVLLCIIRMNASGCVDVTCLRGERKKKKKKKRGEQGTAPLLARFFYVYNTRHIIDPAVISKF